MPIQTDLLVTTNDLQQYLVDKDSGLPLSAGVVTCYKDSARTTLKNWYYQSGTYGAYTYIALPNPLTLSAVGTIVDENGNDTLPFYFPWSETDNQTAEPYYITVDNSNGERQFVRQNFPFDSNTGNSTNEVPTLKNLIVNNNFWNHVGTDINGSATLTNYTSYTLAPSAHDGFSMPDFMFFKSDTGSTDIATFKQNTSKFPSTVDDITPEYYLNHACTTTGGAETFKYYQFPIVLHIYNLQSQQATFTIDAQNVGGNVNNTLMFGIYQFTGSTASAPVFSANTFTKTFTLTNDWKKYTHQFTFPAFPSGGVTGAGDDAFYLVIGLPAGKTCNINFTQPSIYLSDTIPTNDFQTYDEIDAIINSPRTGDYKHTLSQFGAMANSGTFGWVPCNDGSIGNSNASGATTLASQRTWPLYNLLYNSELSHWIPVSGDTGNAYTNFIAGNPMFLPKNLGRVLAGLNPYFTTPVTFTASMTTMSVTGVTAANPGVFTTATPHGMTEGTPIQFNSTGTLPTVVYNTYDTPLTANTTYYVTNPGAFT